MRKHLGLGDKRCPKCNTNNIVKWISQGVRNDNGVIVEWGYFACLKCSWKSEFHETTIQLIEVKKIN